MSQLIPSNTALFTVNNIWMLVSTILVFIMHLGFASLEVGLTRAKNTVNILFKNVSIISIGIITYTLCGFNLMYPGDFTFGNFFGSCFKIGGITSGYLILSACRKISSKILIYLSIKKLSKPCIAPTRLAGS